jgi:tetratricopeptide (TPR) repeat protein
LAIASVAASVIVLAVLTVFTWPKENTAPAPVIAAAPMDGVWIGTYSFDPNNPTSWKPALLWIAECDAASFRGQAWTDDGDYAWNIEGTVEGSHIEWRYARIIHEKTPTRSVQNGASAEGQWDARSIVVNYRDPGDTSRAVIRLHPALRDEKAADDLGARAWKYNDADKLDWAIQICRMSLMIDDRCVTARRCRANAFSKKGQFANAIADLDQAIAIKSEWYSAYADRAWAKTMSGDYDGAFADAERTIQLQPGAADGYYQRGAVNAASKKHLEAIKDFTSAIEKKPDHAWALRERSRSHRVLGNLEQARKDFESARKINPSLPNTD